MLISTVVSIIAGGVVVAVGLWTGEDGSFGVLVARWVLVGVGVVLSVMVGVTYFARRTLVSWTDRLEAIVRAGIEKTVASSRIQIAVAELTHGVVRVLDVVQQHLPGGWPRTVFRWSLEQRLPLVATALADRALAEGRDHVHEGDVVAWFAEVGCRMVSARAVGSATAAFTSALLCYVGVVVALILL